MPTGRVPKRRTRIVATQRTIVAEMEAEQALVAANRELIARFKNGHLGSSL